MSRILILLFFSHVFIACSPAQSSTDCEAEFRAFVTHQTDEFANPEASPLEVKAQKKFKSINYYDFNEAYCLMAEFIRTPDEEPFEMPTSTERKPIYVKYGELHFNLLGNDRVLAVYQNLAMVDDEEYGDYLFLPFNDMTNGDTSYGGGRYLDMRIPEGNTVKLDFNSSYHPYCAYNHKYSCPIPPDENVLDIAIEAGVKSGINGREKN